MIDFEKSFIHLTGNKPFEWQKQLFQQLIDGYYPDACDIPTGLGKTNVMDIWLIALGTQLYLENRKIPLRLVYVVDRRVIVDQATEESLRIINRLTKALIDDANPLHPLAQIIHAASLTGNESLIALSTLRGKKADNRDWCLDPSRPAIIIGTVDMVGSRLLFSGYGKVGINHRSLQAGLLGQDTLIIIDEAHLSPCFVDTVSEINNLIKQKRCIRPFHMISLSATSRNTTNVLRLDIEGESLNEIALRRLKAQKEIEWYPFDQRAKVKVGRVVTANDIRESLTDCIVSRAINYENKDNSSPPQSVIIFVKTVESANLISDKLKTFLKALRLQDIDPGDKKAQKKIHTEVEGRVLKMTGEMRGFERDQLMHTARFNAFLPNRDRLTLRPTQYLIATSCGELGINLDSDHGLCDLSTLDSMIQRIGRINRFGLTSSFITVCIDEHGLQAVAADLQKRIDFQRTLYNLGAEIESLQLKVSAPGLDKVNKKALFEEIKIKTNQKKKLDEKGPDYGQKEIAREELKVYHTWLALKSRADNNGKILVSPSALQGLSTTNKNALPAKPLRPIIDQARIDDWAMTSLKQSEYARPLVHYWLRGVIADDQKQTSFVWRIDLDPFEFLDRSQEESDTLLKLIAESITIIPVQLHERADIATHRAEKLLFEIAKKYPHKAFVVIAPNGETKSFIMRKLANEKENKRIFAELAFSTVILPSSVGGLDADGNPDAKGTKASDQINEEEWTRYLVTRHSENRFSIVPAKTVNAEEMIYPSLSVTLKSVRNKGVLVNRFTLSKFFVDEDSSNKYLIAYYHKRFHVADFLSEDADDSASLDLRLRTIEDHNGDVEKYVRLLCRKIGLTLELTEALAAAAIRHDLGKNRAWWQRSIGNFSDVPYAKSNTKYFDYNINQGYRHEFGSLVESLKDLTLTDDLNRDLILHLIAAHHGYARPHFPERAFDRSQPSPLNRLIAHETLLRFNHLHNKYGCWQLAYLEAILKAADALASRNYVREKSGEE